MSGTLQRKYAAAGEKKMAEQVIAMQEAQELPPEISFVFFLSKLKDQ